MSEIKSERVNIDGETRIKIAIESDKDRIILYLAPETVESLRCHLGATIGLHRGDCEKHTYDVVFDTFPPVEGVKGIEARTPEIACVYAICHRFGAEEVLHIAGSEFSATMYGLPGKIRATATPSPEVL